MAFTSLNHHIDLAWLHEAYRRTRKDGAVGVDRQTAAEYEEHLEENLRSLLDRAKSGTYRAPPVRRVHIPKGGGPETRPIGIPTFEDKILQRAVTMVLEAIYEQDFLDCSYGFRPGRSCHQALEALWRDVMRMGGGWVLELDIRKFFDTLGHAQLREILGQRVQDGVIVRLIGKWLNAGVMEEGQVTYPERGSPQGGVISPILSNIFLHEVLDGWFHREVLPRMTGRAHLIRYADDAVMVFSSERDARRVLEVLPRRFEKYGLALHPEKTRLVLFRSPGDSGDRDGTGPDAFDFLGFTHHWALSRKGRWFVQRQTSRTRFTRALDAIRVWCRQERHQAVASQHASLCRKLRGHAAYYGIPGNSRALGRFWREVTRIWRYWLDRRGQRRSMPWERFHALLERLPLPPARLVHPVAAKP